MAVFQDVFGKLDHLLGREVYFRFHNSFLLIYSCVQLSGVQGRKKINLFLIWTHKFELNTQCEEWKFLFWVEFEHSFCKFGRHTVIIYIMLRYASSFLWKLEKAGDFKSQMEFLLRKHRNFENPISPSACNIFEVFLCIVAMMFSLDHILYCLLHNSTPSSKAQVFTLSVSKDFISPCSDLVGEMCYSCGILAKAPWRELHVWFETPFFSNPLQRGVLCQRPSLALWSDSFWLTELKKAVSVTLFWESAKKKQFCSKSMQISQLQVSGEKQREKREIASCHLVFNCSVILIIILFFFPDGENEVHRLWIQAQSRRWVNNRSHLVKFVFQAVVQGCLSSHFSLRAWTISLTLVHCPRALA